MTSALLSLGSNLGDREAHLRGAIAGLADVLAVVSGVYETPPWGDPDQPAYLNAAALVMGEGITAEQWLARAQALEEAAGRERDPQRRFGPRTLDVDVIMVWSEDGLPVLSNDPHLTLPHPRAHLRAFVLRPWLEIQPYAHLPGHGWVNDLIRQEPAASDVLKMTARPEISLESEG
jgi:2-amino-4-hydroxy-6-hydroxymethyldihydropteridine diphosphokinase